MIIISSSNVVVLLGCMTMCARIIKKKRPISLCVFAMSDNYS